MGRIEFDGIGEPIPSIALPPFGSGVVPPTVLTFTENADFSAQTYRDLGFTHYEAWCVGAAGGKGGDATGQAIPIYELVQRPVPQEIWNLQLEQLAIWDARLTPPKDFYNDYYTTVHIPGQPNYPPGGVPGNDYGWPFTHYQYVEYNNPNHLMTFTTYKPFALFPSLQGVGGGGGGGGMQKVSGLLENLAATVPIVVGKAGADAPVGQTKAPGVWTPTMADDPTHYIKYANVTNRDQEITNFLTDYTHSYPPPQSSFLAPQAGGDGGASTFADDVCRASGGQGGFPGMIWDGSKFILKGSGGAGGVGGRTAAGGGGLGSTAEGVNGADGIWRPELGLGEGGGGGKGGRNPEAIGDPRFGAPTVINHLASAGGQGSYSFADTSVYGARQFRQGWTYLKPVTVIGSGVVTYVFTTESQYLVTPGGGGGARPLRNLKVGSRAPGYSPDGVVVVRLTQIND